MQELRVTRCDSVRLAPDPRRVITRPFMPREEIYPDGSTRMQIVLERILAMPPGVVVDTLGTARAMFAGRHRDLAGVLVRNFEIVADRFEHLELMDRSLSSERRDLIAAYFTHEFSVEAAALGNPSMVAAPDQSGRADGELGVVVSLRAIGEGHISSIEFRTGAVGPGAQVRIDTPSVYATTGTTREHGSDGADYFVEFPATSELSERVLFPSHPTESHGMEDARFVRFVDDGADTTYYATYTAFDGHHIRPQLLQTDDFVEFHVSTLTGRAAENKGIALFPRRVGGRYLALGRHDNVNNYLMASDDVRAWHDATVIQEPERPWELMQLGNCGSPLETDAGWLVITHGVGPFRRYTLGAVLLDLDEPSRVIGHLKEPLLSPTDDEREGYVPNVVYSCGGLIHDAYLVLPYGFADVGANVATIPVGELLSRLTR